jgi:hypothetical protein
MNFPKWRIFSQPVLKLKQNLSYESQNGKIIAACYIHRTDNKEGNFPAGFAQQKITYVTI